VLDNRYSMESSRWRIEVRSIKTGATSTLYESDQFLADFRLISNHELLMSQQLGRGSNSSQLLTATVNLETGSRSVTHVVTTSPDGLQAIFNSTRDGKTLVAITGRFFSAIYIADLGEDQVTMSHIRRLTLNDSHSLPAGWLSDSETVLMFSNRAGHYGIFQQAIDSPDARAIVSGDHDYVRPVVSADGKWLFYFMAGDVSRQQAFSKKTLMRQAMSGGIPQEIDTKSDFYRSMRCAVTVNRCVLSEREGDFIVFYQFDPEKGRGAEWFRAKWSPTVTGFFWDLSHDGTRIAYIDTASGSNDIGIETQSDDKTTKAQLHLDGYDPFATLYWDGTGKGFYVSSYNSNGDVLKLLHVGMDGKVAVLRQQISTQLSWAIPSPNGKHLAFQKFARKSNIWLLKRQ